MPIPAIMPIDRRDPSPEGLRRRALHMCVLTLQRMSLRLEDPKPLQDHERLGFLSLIEQSLDQAERARLAE